MQLAPDGAWQVDPSYVHEWPGVGALEVSHALEYLRVGGLLESYEEELVERGQNGQRFLLMDQKKKQAKALCLGVQLVGMIGEAPSPICNHFSAMTL